jgi:hypothetical protein
MTSHPKQIERLQSYQDDITDRESQEAYEIAIAATEDWLNSEGYRLYEHMIVVDRSAVLVHGNYQELTECLSGYRDKTPGIYWEDLQKFGDEFSRYLFNYVGSVKSMENRVDKMLSEIDDICNRDPPVGEEYEKRVSDFDVGLHGAFFTSLRNILVHVSPIDCFTVYTDEDIDGYRYAIPTKEILNDDEWTAAAKGYADGCGNQVFMGDVIEAYNRSLEKLYNWFIEHVESRFEDRFEECDKLAERARELQDEFFDVCGIEMMKIAWKSREDNEVS